MSYCRWSSMDGMCDLYAYEHCGGFWALHVAVNRTIVPWSQLPQLPDEFKMWSSDRRSYTLTPEGIEWERQKDEEYRRPIGLPFDGETFELASPGECADKMEELMALGYNAPAAAIESLREEQAEIDAAQRIEARSDETVQLAQPEGQEPGPEGMRHE